MLAKKAIQHPFSGQNDISMERWGATEQAIQGFKVQSQGYQHEMKPY